MGFRKLLIAAALSALFVGNAMALVIEYELTELGGTDYRYDYTVTNDGSVATQIGLFDISFDVSLYDELSLTPIVDDAVAADWDIFVLGSAPGVPAVLDLFSFSSGLGVGDSLSGFGVSFSWLGGADGPGMQDFEVFDPFSFDFLGSGQTQLAESKGPVSVPAPATILLLLAGLLFLRRPRIPSTPAGFWRSR